MNEWDAFCDLQEKLVRRKLYRSATNALYDIGKRYFLSYLTHHWGDPFFIFSTATDFEGEWVPRRHCRSRNTWSETIEMDHMNRRIRPERHLLSCHEIKPPFRFFLRQDGEENLGLTSLSDSFSNRFRFLDWRGKSTSSLDARDQRWKSLLRAERGWF